MTPEGRQKIKTLLLKSESYKQFPYVDSTGNVTIGIGRNLKTRGIFLTEALYLLDEDINYFLIKLRKMLSFFENLSENRQIVLIDMCFNLGLQGLLNFTHMIDALAKGDFALAGQSMLASKWASQVGERAEQLAEIMITNNIG